MSPDIPAWQPVDPASGDLPEALRDALDSVSSTAGCVALLVTSEVDRRWGADTSLLLARDWAARGRSVLLADASLDDPVLHGSVDGANREGLADMMLYGASVKHVARPIGDGVLLVPAGTPVADAAEVLAHPKWDRVIGGFREAGALLLLHISAATPGGRALLDRVEGVIVVSEPGADVSSILGSASDRVLAVVGPQAVEEAAEAEIDSSPEPKLEVEMISGRDDEQLPELEAESALEVESGSESETGPVVESDEAPVAATETAASGDGPFSIDELPASTGNSADEVDESGAFSFDDMTGSQYMSDPVDEDPDVLDLPAHEEPLSGDLEESTEAETEPEDDEDLSLSAGELEVEPLELEAPDPELPEAVSPPTVEESPAPPQGGLPAVEGVTRSEVEMDAAAMSAAAQEAHFDMDGFETGAGFDLEDAPSDLEEGPGDQVEDAHEFGFGDGALEVEGGPLAEGDTSEEAGAGGLSGTAGDVAFGDRAPSPGDPEARKPSDDAPLAGAAAGSGESIAVGAADEAMGYGADSTRSEDVDTAGAVDRDTGPPAKMSGLEELERRRRRGARARQLLVGVATALIVGGGGLAVAYLGFVNIPGITPPERVRTGVLPPVELPGPTPLEPVISHVLILDAWRSLETAVSTVDALRERLPEFLFVLTVLDVNGVNQFTLLVGPAFSAVEANALKEPLAEVLDRLDPATWTVQEARYSFFFGEYADAADAEGRVQSLAALGIPAHVLQVSYPDNTMGLRVYGGAFVDEFQAASMGRILRENDLDDARLTERRGRLPE